MIMGVMQVKILPQYLGFDSPVDLGHHACSSASSSARLIGAFQGVIIAFLERALLHRHARRPARLARRRLVGHQRPDGRADGRHLPPHGRRRRRLDRRDLELDRRRHRLPRSSSRSSSTRASSASASASRCGRSGPSISSAVLGCVLVLGAVCGRQQLLLAGQHRHANMPRPTAFPGRTAGCISRYGIAMPVLVAIGVGIVMTFIATRTRFGRYVFAIGGNPEAAELAGIKTRWVTVKIFTLMGVLVRHRRRDLDRPPQRRHQRAGHARRALHHRRRRHRRHVACRRHRHDRRRHARRARHAVAAVGHGAAADVDTPLQSIVVGVVLVVAVWLDTVYRARAK